VVVPAVPNRQVPDTEGSLEPRSSRALGQLSKSWPKKEVALFFYFFNLGKKTITEVRKKGGREGGREGGRREERKGKGRRMLKS
jgi:hypothetical protein